MRIISIETPPALSDRIQAIIKKIKSQLDHRNVKVNYNISDKFRAQLCMVMMDCLNILLTYQIIYLNL